MLRPLLLLCFIAAAVCSDTRAYDSNPFPFDKSGDGDEQYYRDSPAASLRQNYHSKELRPKAKDNSNPNHQAFRLRQKNQPLSGNNVNDLNTDHRYSQQYRHHHLPQTRPHNAHFPNSFRDSDSGTPKFQLRVATFNVWGLIISKNRVERMDAIARYFSQNPKRLHVIGFQELWMEEDYRKLKSALSLAFPYSHYFSSGVFGSGLAIFSRYPIQDSWWLSFTSTGKPQRIFDGDWYAGKGVGAVRIKHPKAGSIDIFNTHLIADYSPNNYDKDWYKAHRATQFYELVRHVDRTGDPAAFTIVMGDLNTQPIEDAYISLIKSQELYTPIRRGLRNVWRDLPKFKTPQSPVTTPLDGQDPDHWTTTFMKMLSVSAQHNTFNLPSNTYYKSSMPSQQIDHVMYIPDGRIRCIHAEVFLKRPSKTASGVAGPSYSDHSPLMAVFELAPLAPISLNDHRSSSSSEDFNISPMRRAHHHHHHRHPVRNHNKRPISQATHNLMIRLNEEIQSLFSQQWGYRVGAVVCALFGIGCLVAAVLLLRRANSPEEMQKLLTVETHPEDYKWWERISPNWFAFGLLLIGGVLAVYFHWMIWNAIVFLPQEIYALKTFQYEWALWLKRHS